MTNLLKFSKELSFPLEVVTQKLAFLGQSGGGKTYDAMKLAELMLEYEAQIVVIDIPGVWYGLRSSADGKSAGFKILVVGGEHGDLPINANAGALIADMVVDSGLSVVLDVSEMLEEEQLGFLLAFLTRLFDRKKRSRSPLHLFIEECQEVIPETTNNKLQQRLRAVAIRLMKIGRNYGFGWSAISQEPQAASKRAINQAGTLIVVRTVGSHERKAIGAWARSKLKSKEQLGLMDILPELETGQALAWSPSWLKFAGIVHVHEKITFDSSKTPEVGKKRPQAKVMADIDLEKLKTDMAALVEQKEAEDPTLLRKKISELQRELAKKPAAAPAPTKTETKAKEVAVALKKDVVGFHAGISRIELLQTKIEKLNVDMAKLFEPLVARCIDLSSKLNKATVVETPGTRTMVIGGNFTAPLKTYKTQKELDVNFGVNRLKILPKSEPLVKYGPPSEVAKAANDATAISGERLGKGERAVLSAIAQHAGGVTREQLSVLTGYKRSSRDTYLQKLSSAGRIVEFNDCIQATQIGVDDLGSDFHPLPVGDALREHWLRKLPEGERRVLEVVISHHPNAIPRETIDEATGYKRSSRDTYLQKLGARRLVDSDRNGIRASDMLFGAA